MTLTPQERKLKMRLAKCVRELGFHEVQEITNLSGSSLGQYTGLDYPRCISEHKLKLVELTLCQKNSSNA